METAKRSASGSEEDERNAMMDEKKRKRMISNRESARRSRMKREQHMKDLNNQIIFFKNKRNEMTRKINEFTRRYAAVETENRVLRAQREELRKRLESAQLISSYLDAAEGYNSVDIADDPWLKPWQPPSQALPIMTSAGFLQF